MNGALLIHKHQGVSSFGIIEILQRQLMEKEGTKKRDLPKLGHGGTLDPFATGLLVVCVGRAVKLARYFLGATKTYEGVIRFGETTAEGDVTGQITERTDQVPSSLEEIRSLAERLTKQAYLQTPPMFSAKKKDGKPLYELARAGIEVEREPKLCQLYRFEILDYTDRRARFRLVCSSGTYVRTLAQDLAKLLGSIALLESLSRSSSGCFQLTDAWSTDQILEAGRTGARWDEMPCWIPFDRLLESYARIEATREEAESLCQGRQNVLFNLVKRMQPAPSPFAEPTIEEASCAAIYTQGRLVAVARREEHRWELERVFPMGSEEG